MPKYLVCSITLLTLCSAFEFCEELKNCVDCTENDFKCVWEKGSEVCSLRTSLHSDSNLVFDDTCPIDYGVVEDGFLPNWMGDMLSVIGDSTLLDLSLPGTHDTLTYDLSTTVAEGGIDEMYKLAEFLHNHTNVVPDLIEDFIRSGAQTQDMTVAEQLNAGIRFLDVRMMLQYSDTPPVWYSLHMMQSTDTSTQYFRDIRKWMDAHPTEIVVMWLSKHGNECATGQEQYPYVSVEQKQTFWAEVLAIFEDMAVDFSQTKINETTIRTMIERNHRAVFYVADYVEMTNYSTESESYFALDSCLIDNQLGNPSGPASVQWQRDLYAAANSRKAADKAEQRLYLVSYAGGMDYVHATLLKFGVFDKIPVNDTELIAECAATFDIAGMNWCPETLLDGSQIANYYSQVAMDEVIEQMLRGNTAPGLPHAVYINAIGSAEGTIRTGTEVLWGKNRSPDSTHAKQGFCYVDTFLLYNVLSICSRVSTGEMKDACEQYTDVLVQRRSKNGMTLWDDAKYGRLSKW